MSSSLDDVEHKCNELMEKAVSATELHVRLQRDLSIEVRLKDGNGFLPKITFPVATSGMASSSHSHVFSTLARIVGTNGLPNVGSLCINLPKGVDGRNDTHTTEMTPFIQSIAGSSTIQRIHVGANNIGHAPARAIQPFPNDATESTDLVCVVAALATNLVSPQSVLKKLLFRTIAFDDELLTIFCELLSANQCRLVELRLEDCRFPTLGPVWSALAANQSISTLDFYHAQMQEGTQETNNGTQQLQSMLKTNTTMKNLKMTCRSPGFPNSFFAALGAGLALNSTLTTLDLPFGSDSEQGYINVLFEDGLDRNTGLEKLQLEVHSLNDAHDLVCGLDRMAQNLSNKRSLDGSHKVSPLKHLYFYFDWEDNFEECADIILDGLIPNSEYFALEEIHSECRDLEDYVYGVSLFSTLATFILVFPTVSVVTMSTCNETVDDSNLSTLADAMEDNTTLTEFQFDKIDATGDFSRRNRWSPSDNPNHARILCSVLQNRRELPLFVELSKKNLLPSALATLVEPKGFEAVHVVNLTHAFHLIRNLPELFSS